MQSYVLTTIFENMSIATLRDNNVFNLARAQWAPRSYFDLLRD